MSEESFQSIFASYRHKIDKEIERYVAAPRESYGVFADEVVHSYNDLLLRGGKRLRGALTMVGYELCGGKDESMIIQAARALEMLQAYILIIDDIQDRSLLRRGKPAVHVMLKQFAEESRLADADHVGLALALDAALYGLHQTEKTIALLDASEKSRLTALTILNEAMTVTIHGQTWDIVNQLRGEVTEQDVENVMEWKTAHYSFLNPLQVGMALAGGSEEERQKIADYATLAGKTFQITDDILGVFGKPDTSGKMPMDDIKEGKKTILTIHSLAHASEQDALFLQKMLGNQKITEEEFERIKEIIVNSGALEFARASARTHASNAQKSLAGLAFEQTPIQFLHLLVASLVDRAV